jgi:trypsin
VRSDVVLTAAHCLLSETCVTVHLGIHRLSEIDLGTTGESIRVATSIAHPSYNPSTMQNDVALLFLETNSTYQPIQLLQNESAYNDGMQLTTMGWGATSSGGSSSDKLLEANITVDATCGNYPPPGRPDMTVYSESMFCAGASGKDSCQGDSGGTVVDGSGPFLVGIVSWGYGCADAEYPGVYARVWDHRDWIQRTVAPDEPQCDDGCTYSNDDECDDGGCGSMFSLCALGTDCSDCGSRRVPTTPSPSIAQSAPPRPPPLASPTTPAAAPPPPAPPRSDSCDDRLSIKTCSKRRKRGRCVKKGVNKKCVATCGDRDSERCAKKLSSHGLEKCRSRAFRKKCRLTCCGYAPE